MHVNKRAKARFINYYRLCRNTSHFSPRLFHSFDFNFLADLLQKPQSLRVKGKLSLLAKTQNGARKNTASIHQYKRSVID